MRRHGFATLVTHGEGGLVASHLPLLLDADAGPQGHPARPHGQGQPAVAVDRGARSMAVFHGPHAYVSPVLVRGGGARSRPGTTSPSTPTARSTSSRTEDGLLDILRRSVAAYEGPRPEPWAFDESEPHVEGLLKAIVGFRIEITRLEGKWKLSPEPPEERRRKVIRALEAAGR